jgi:hypothetical protein
MTKAELTNLTWRYAALIGIVRPDPNYADEAQVAADRERWPDFLETSAEGNPVFDFDRAAAWMAEVSGNPLDECVKVLDDEWYLEDSEIEALERGEKTHVEYGRKEQK